MKGILEQVQHMARELERGDLAEFARAVQAGAAAQSLRLVIAGERRIDLWWVVQLLSGSEVPPAVALQLLHHAARLRLAHGEKPSLEVHRPGEPGGSSLSLEEFTRQAEADARQDWESVTLRLPGELLRRCELTLEFIDRSVSPEAWRQRLASADFVFLVLFAPQLLSELERQFVREVLQPSVGLARAALLVTGTDKVEAAELPAVFDYVRRFLGPLESQPLLLGVEAKPSGSGSQELLRFLQGDLLGAEMRWRADSLRSACNTCLDLLEQAVQERQALLEANESELARAISRLDSRKGEVESRLAQLLNRIDLLVLTLVKQETFRDVEQFSQSLQQSLRQELPKATDVLAVRKHLQAYLGSTWSEYCRRLEPAWQQKLREGLREIVQEALSSMQEMVGGLPLETLAGELQGPEHLSAFLIPRKGKSNVSLLAGAMGFAGLVMLLGASLPVGLALLGGGSLVRLAGKGAIQEADLEALLASALEASREAELQLKGQLGAGFEKLASQLRQRFRESYQAGVEQIRKSLVEAMERRQQLAERRGTLSRWSSEVLPALRASMAASSNTARA